MKKIRCLLLAILCLVFIFGIPALYCQGGRAGYEQAVRYIKQKQYDFALLELRAVTRDFPESRYAEKSLFAIAEYFYIQKVYYEASRHFAEYIRLYPDSDAVVFARTYLLKVIEGTKEPEEEEGKVLDAIKMEFFSKPLFLLFSEYKEVSYKSAFQNHFTIRYYVDMIEVYRNDEIFIKISQ